MYFKTILVIAAALLVQGILAEVGGSRDRRSLQAGDRGRSFGSGADGASSRTRLGGPGGDAAASRQRGDASPLRSRPSTSGRDASPPRLRLASSAGERQRLTSSGGDATFRKQRSSDLGGDATLTRQRSTNSGGDVSPARQRPGGNASPTRQRAEELEKTPEPALTQEEEEVLLEFGSMRKEVQSLQQETLSMFKDLYKSSMLPEDDGDEKMDAAAKERLQVLLREGSRKLGATADEFVKLVDNNSKAIIDNAGDPEIIPWAQKKVVFLLGKKNEILKLNAQYMTMIERNLKGMLNTVDEFEMGPPAKPIPARGPSRSAPVPRGEKRAIPGKQLESATPARPGTPIRRKNSLRDTN